MLDPPPLDPPPLVRGTARGFTLEPAAACEVERDGAWHPGTALGGYGDRLVVRFTVAVGETYQQAVPVTRVRAPVRSTGGAAAVQARTVVRELVAAASTSSRTVTPRPGPVGTEIWPSRRTKGSVTSSA